MGPSPVSHSKTRRPSSSRSRRLSRRRRSPPGGMQMSPTKIPPQIRPSQPSQPEPLTPPELWLQTSLAKKHQDFFLLIQSQTRARTTPHLGEDLGLLGPDQLIAG